MTGVYLEMGQRRVFACALDWPGWCRAGRSEESALEALLVAGPRFSVACAGAGIAFDADAVVAELSVLERVRGSTATDFGALDVAPALDHEPVCARDAARLAAFVRAAWDAFDRTAAAAPPTLRKGPRGGGRDTAEIVEHVLETELLHARMLGLKQRPFPPGDQAAAAAVRRALESAVARCNEAGTPAPDGRAQRPARFVARRIAWHALDHAWEIQDKQGPA